MSTLRALALALVTVFFAACASDYYKVTDPANGKVFYTKEVKRNGSAVEFRDAQTNSVVTLQNSEIQQINEQTYETAVAKK